MGYIVNYDLTASIFNSDSRFQIQDFRFKISDSRFKIQDSGWGIQDGRLMLNSREWTMDN